MQCSSTIASYARLVCATVAAALVIAISGFVPQAHAVTAAEVEAQAQEVLVQINAMQDKLDEYSEQYFKALYEYQAAIEARDATQERIDELTAEIAEIQDRLGARARDMYREGPLSFLDLLFGSASFEEFTTNWELLNRINESDAEMSARIKELRIEAENEKAEYTRQAEIAEQKSQEAAQAYAEAEALVLEMEETYNSLSAEAQELYAQEAAAAAAAAAAQAQAEAEAAAAAAATVEINEDGSVTDLETGETYASADEYYELTGNEIVDRAYAMIGADYVWGGTGGDMGGFDCSGFVSYALTGETGVRLGTTATFAEWNQVDDPQPGDVCVIHEEDGNQHTGIYVGDGKMVHASTYGVGVVEGDVQEGMIYVRP